MTTGPESSGTPRESSSHQPTGGPLQAGASVPDEIDPRTPLFFLSYAHAGEGLRRPSDRNAWFADFFDELSENVGQLIGRRTGSDPGYMDQSIPDGDHWTDRLLQAVGTCQVFVALLSEPYITSPWCGMEWHAFSQRTVIPRPGGADGQTAIIPVIWAPFDRNGAPRAVRAVQWFSPDGLPNITAEYRQHGIFGLMRMESPASHQAIWRLALAISGILRSCWVAPHVFNRNELRDIFREERC